MREALITIGGWALILAVVLTVLLLGISTAVWAWQDRGPKPPQACR